MTEVFLGSPALWAGLIYTNQEINLNYREAPPLQAGSITRRPESARAMNETTNRIFMTRVKSSRKSSQVKLAVFIKGTRGHQQNLMGFLENQKISCSEIEISQRREMPEFAYFDEGFFITVAPERWSFYELRSFIQTYADACREQVLLRDTLQEEMSTCDESLIFDDGFYVQLDREIHRFAVRYYQENMSISLFISSVLSLLRQNLQLYWAAAMMMDAHTRKLNYLNHDPPGLPRKNILNLCNEEDPERVVCSKLVFCDDHLADFFLLPGPFSPGPAVIDRFLSQVITQIDAFVYGHLQHRIETVRLKSEIAELKKSSIPTEAVRPERESKTRKKIKLLLIGDSHMSSGQMFSIFSQFGFDRQNVDLQTEYEKYRNFDTNNLLQVRSRYDGILLGPMPHSMKGALSEGEGLIVQMQREPERYPPFVVVRDKRGDLKISKTALKESIQQIVSTIEKVGSYS